MKNLTDKIDAFTRKARDKMSILMFELNHKNWKKIADGKEGEQDKHFVQFLIISLEKFGTFYSAPILGSRHG